MEWNGSVEGGRGASKNYDTPLPRTIPSFVFPLRLWSRTFFERIKRSIEARSLNPSRSRLPAPPLYGSYPTLRNAAVHIAAAGAVLEFSSRNVHVGARDTTCSVIRSRQERYFNKPASCRSLSPPDSPEIRLHRKAMAHIRVVRATSYRVSRLYRKEKRELQVSHSRWRAASRACARCVFACDLRAFIFAIIRDIPSDRPYAPLCAALSRRLPVRDINMHNNAARLNARHAAALSLMRHR